MARQRVRVEGSDAWWVTLIAAIGALGVLVAGPSPTGGAVIDVVLVGAAVAATIWAAASAPWWAGVAACAVAAACAPGWVLAMLGLVGAAGGVAVGLARRAVPWSRAIVAAVALQVLARLDNLEHLGISALVAISVASFLALSGVLRRPRRERRVVGIVLGSLLGVVLIAVIGATIAGTTARHDLEGGADAAQEGVAQLADGDFVGARTSFDRAAVLFDRASSRLSSFWAQPARLLPVVAQHRSAATRLTAAAAAVSAEAARSLAEIDVDAVRVVDGRIDLDAVRALEDPLVRLQGALTDLSGEIEAVDSPWLLDQLTTRLEDLSGDIDRQRLKGDNAIAAVQQAPALLGGEGRRVYFVAFTTPVEARGLGGFMGNWAEVTITDGDIEISGFGRHTDLNQAGDPTTRSLDGPTDFLAQYADFGFRNADGTMRSNIWSDVTMSPHFPSVADVIAQLYPQSGGQELDGVFAMDVYALAGLMQITGPVELPGLDFAVTPENAADFMLSSQYTLFEDVPERVDALEVVALTTVERLLNGDLPSPPQLAELMSPYVDQGRLLGWSRVPAEQALLENVRMDGALPALAGGNGITVTFNNAGNSKIDYYLDGAMSYDVTTSEGGASAVLTLDLTNGAPSAGLPFYVIGNNLDKPLGTSTLYVSVYSAVPFSSATLDGEPIEMESGAEAGWAVASAFVELSSKESARLVVRFEGVPAADGPVAVRVPATVRPLPLTVTVDGTIRGGGPIESAGESRR